MSATHVNIKSVFRLSIIALKCVGDVTNCLLISYIVAMLLSYRCMQVWSNSDVH